MCSFYIWKTEIVLRRSKIFIATGIQIAVSSVGAAYYGQHLHIHIVFAVHVAAESDGLQADSPGRKISVRFPTPIHSSAPVIKYIKNQQEHHRCKSFSEEYVELLKRFNVPHDQRYIFQPVNPD
jgi:hypothetical protein